MSEMPIDLVVRNHAPNATPNPLLGVTAAADGGLWFTGAISNSIWRLGTDGQTAEFVLPTSGATPGGIVAASGSALWFTEVTANQIGRITSDGSITEYLIPTPRILIALPYAWPLARTARCGSPRSEVTRLAVSPPMESYANMPCQR